MEKCIKRLDKIEINYNLKSDGEEEEEDPLEGEEEEDLELLSLSPN